MERRRGTSKRYYYRSVREGERVRKVYLGRDGTLEAVAAQVMIGERKLDRRDRKTLNHEIAEARRAILSLLAEVRSVTKTTLMLAGYDSEHCRRISGLRGRPTKTGITLRELYASDLNSVRIEVACQMIATAINELANLRSEPEDSLRRKLCRRLMAEAQDIAGEEPLPAEQVLAIAIVITHEFEEMLAHFQGNGLGTRWGNGPNPSTPESLLNRLREKLERRVSKTQKLTL